jgi:hypothetical protein
MDFGTWGGAILAFFIAWNFWAIALIALVFLVGAFVWKLAITPREYQERLAYAQAKENQKLTQPKIRRIGMTGLIYLFGIMASTAFCVILYKMFE